jgi:NADPH:quinone reductase-like Zn-dependent oxidoreductase
VKAVRTHDLDGWEGLVVEDAPVPPAAPGTALIRVCAAGVNPADWQLLCRPSFHRELPWTPGFDVCGVVESIDGEASHLSVGDRVFGMVNFPAPAGTYAEYVAAPVGQIARAPRSLDHVEAASLPVVGLTAWQALVGAAGMAPGQKVLIHGGAGGVGHLAVQLAKWRGATVVATASVRNHEFLASLGADECVDYTAVRFEDVVTDAHAVLDPFGGELTRRSVAALTEDGILVSLKTVEPPAAAEARRVRFAYVLAKPGASDLAEIGRLVDAGVLKPHLETVLPLEDAREALELSRRGHARGKIVLRVER